MTVRELIFNIDKNLDAKKITLDTEMKNVNDLLKAVDIHKIFRLNITKQVK